ncbi:hypothetical protein EJ110_NYTH46458 [Nymphaea thermarum]|nr:hypothetical protein EJ110_NYTH46458 [Nymphaea thermarum]
MTSFTDSHDESPPNAAAEKEEPSSVIRLPPFGVATYKLSGEVWLSDAAWDQDRIYSLWTSALQEIPSKLDSFVLHKENWRAENK